jgi:hypothetical protein
VYKTFASKAVTEKKECRPGIPRLPEGKSYRQILKNIYKKFGTKVFEKHSGNKRFDKNVLNK